MRLHTSHKDEDANALATPTVTWLPSPTISNSDQSITIHSCTAVSPVNINLPRG